MKKIAALAAPLLLALAFPAFGQSFTGPATITAPTTTNHCVKIGPGGGNNLVDAGANCGTGTAPLPANPTATIGSTAVNGTAITYMRSDGAPALPATLPALNGSLLTNLAGANIAAGSVANAALTNASTTVNGQTCTLGLTCLATSYSPTFANIGLASAAALNMGSGSGYGINSATAIFQSPVNAQAALCNNVYLDNTGPTWKYITSTYAACIRMYVDGSSSGISFYNVPTGTAGGTALVDTNLTFEITGRAANSTAVVTPGSTGPTGTTCTIASWLAAKDNGGNVRYMPLFSCS